MSSSNTYLNTNNVIYCYIIVILYWQYALSDFMITNKNNNLYLCCLFVLSLRTRRLDKVDHGWVRSDLNKAFQVWAQYSKLTFREVNSESADILVFFEKLVLGFVPLPIRIVLMPTRYVAP